MCYRKDRLLDNDVVLKVCQYDIHEEFFSTCAAIERIAILPTLKYVFHLDDDNKAIPLIKSQDALKRIRGFIKRVSEVDESQISADRIEKYNELVAIFQNIDQIDSGEAILFSIISVVDSSVVFTGDKRSIVALSNVLNTDQKETVRGRIKCLEQTFAEILLGNDSELVGQKVRGELWDNSLRACFASTSTDGILEGLKSYYDDLNRLSGNVLAPFPIHD